MSDALRISQSKQYKSFSHFSRNLSGGNPSPEMVQEFISFWDIQMKPLGYKVTVALGSSYARDLKTRAGFQKAVKVLTTKITDRITSNGELLTKQENAGEVVTKATGSSFGDDDTNEEPPVGDSAKSSAKKGRSSRKNKHTGACHNKKDFVDVYVCDMGDYLKIGSSGDFVERWDDYKTANPFAQMVFSLQGCKCVEDTTQGLLDQYRMAPKGQRGCENFFGVPKDVAVRALLLVKELHDLESTVPTVTSKGTPFKGCGTEIGEEKSETPVNGSNEVPAVFFSPAGDAVCTKLFPPVIASISTSINGCDASDGANDSLNDLCARTNAHSLYDTNTPEKIL